MDLPQGDVAVAVFAVEMVEVIMAIQNSPGRWLHDVVFCHVLVFWRVCVGSQFGVGMLGVQVL